MLKLSNIRIPVRIAIACLLPLLAFTGFAVKELLDRRSASLRRWTHCGVAEAAPMISEARARAAERARLSRSDSSTPREQSFADAMRNQRPVTDKALAAWKQRVAEYSKSLCRNEVCAQSRCRQVAAGRTSAACARRSMRFPSTVRK